MTSYHLGLVGYPLGHSLSPQLHQAALNAHGLDGEYSLFPIHPDDGQGLRDLLARVRSGEIHGLNVTIPHKQHVIPLLDELTETASSIGAANTIYGRAGKLLGDNTDAPGFFLDLKKFLTTETRRNGDSKALILGAGGSARAVVHALLSNGWMVALTARRLEQAVQLAGLYENHRLTVTANQLLDLATPSENLQSLVSNLFLVVNTTPVGMAPNIDQSPWPGNLPLPPRAAVYDLVYNPRVTKLVSDARQQGLQATTGLGMLVEQAALAFEIWTGHTPPRDAMFASVEHLPISNL